MFVRPLLLVPFVAACSGEPTLQGMVVDVWGNPVEGATVVVEGLPERPLTDSAGLFEVPMPPAGPLRLKAGREGYVQEHLEFTIPEDTAQLHRPVIELFPKPDDPGFYVVGISEYERLDAAAVQQVSNPVETVRGVVGSGPAAAVGPHLRVLFHTPLKMDQVMRLNVQLHELALRNRMDMAGPLGMVPVDINLYTSVRRVPVEIRPLRSRHDYLIVSKIDLEPGLYAFDTQGLLTATQAEMFNQVPEPLRVSYPFELR